MGKEFPDYTEGSVEEELSGWRPAIGFQGVENGDITASLTKRMLGVVERACKIRAINIALAETGADGSNPLSIVVDVKLNGTSIFDSGTTKPTLSKADSDYDNNRVELTEGTDTVDVVAGDVLTYDVTLTRTASPSTEMAGVVVRAEIHT